MSWRRLEDMPEDVLKTCLRDKQNTYWWYLCLRNENLWWSFGVVKSAEFKLNIAEKVRQKLILKQHTIQTHLNE